MFRVYVTGTTHEQDIQSTRYQDNRINPDPNHMMQILIRDAGAPEPFCQFIPPHQMHAMDNYTSGSSDESQQHNHMTVFNGPSNSKTPGASQPRNTGIQMSPGEPVPIGVIGAMQTSPRRISQIGGTPPPSPRRAILTGGIQTPPPHTNMQDQGTQGQLDHNHNKEDLLAQNAVTNTGKGKKDKKKSAQEAALHPGTSTGGFVIPRTDFQSRNLGTGRPTIQCTACGEYTHWRRECPYDKYCTTCNNHDPTTHMSRALR